MLPAVLPGVLIALALGLSVAALWCIPLWRQAERLQPMHPQHPTEAVMSETNDAETKKSCGTCRHWRLMEGRNDLGTCLVPLPAWCDGMRGHVVLNKDDAAWCRVWATTRTVTVAPVL